MSASDSSVQPEKMESPSSPSFVLVQSGYSMLIEIRRAVQRDSPGERSPVLRENKGLQRVLSRNESEVRSKSSAQMSEAMPSV